MQTDPQLIGNVRQASTVQSDGPTGIGGWLIFAAIILPLAPIIYLIVFLKGLGDLVSLGALLQPEHPYHSPWWLPLVVGEQLYLLTGMVASCWLAILFFRRKAKFPRLLTCVNVAMTSLMTVDLLAVWLMSVQFPDLWKQEQLIGHVRAVISTWIGVWIWMTYLSKSRRVRNTFVR